MNKVRTYLGLGSNLGSRWDSLRLALVLLEDPRGQIRVLRTSQVYETYPWGFKEQPDFLNCVAEITTELEPDQLLRRAKEVEKDMGRQSGPRYGPRLIDIDILLYGDQSLERAELEVPHPRLHLRAFALVPLAELVPSLVHPTLKKTIADLAESVEGSERLEPLGALERPAPQN